MTAEIIDFVKAFNARNLIDLKFWKEATETDGIEAIVFDNQTTALALRLYTADARELFDLLVSAKDAEEFVEHFIGFMEDDTTVLPPQPGSAMAAVAAISVLKDYLGSEFEEFAELYLMCDKSVFTAKLKDALDGPHR